MKNLEKMKINSERLLKEKELLVLRGGYDGEACGQSCIHDTDCPSIHCPKCYETPGGWPPPMCTS